MYSFFFVVGGRWTSPYTNPVLYDALFVVAESFGALIAVQSVQKESNNSCYPHFGWRDAF